MITLYYESRFGLARGAIYHNDLPQLYAEGYEYDPSLGVLGARSVARLTAKSGGMAFLTLADGEEAVLEGQPEVLGQLHEGAAVEVEVTAEARSAGRKRVRARFVARAEGEPRRLSEPLRLQERLLARSAALLGEMPVRLGKASEALDDARDAALNPSGPLSNGGFLTIEPTQALIACDIDSSTAGQGMVPGKTFMKACNELAVDDLGRRLRLANLGGLIVVDLIGRRHDGKRLTQVLKAGFAAEGPQVITGPIGKFGTLECVRPWGARPWSEGVKPDGAALYRVNQAIRLAGQDRGRVVVIRDRGAVIEVLRPLLVGSIDPLTPMLRLEISDRPEVIAL